MTNGELGGDRRDLPPYPGHMAKWGVDPFEFTAGPMPGWSPLPGLAKGSVTLKGHWKPRAYPHFKPGCRVTQMLGRDVVERIVIEVTRNEFVGDEAVLEFKSRPLRDDDPPRTRAQQRMIRQMRWSQRRGELRSWFRRLVRRG